MMHSILRTVSGKEIFIVIAFRLCLGIGMYHYEGRSKRRMIETEWTSQLLVCADDVNFFDDNVNVMKQQKLYYMLGSCRSKRRYN
jgi:hypothetical protein